MIEPYIGITGFTHADQAVVMRGVLDSIGCRHLLHAGVMMDWDMLRGIPNEWSDIFPPKEDIWRVFERSRGVMNVIHYADYGDRTDADDLLAVLDYAGPNVSVIQLDMPWPNPGMLREVRRKRIVRGQDLQFVVQIGRKALKMANHDPEEVAKLLHEYRILGCIDYALFDMSGGEGLPMDAPKLLNFIWPALQAIPDLSIAVAGGLGPYTMELALPVVDAFAPQRIPISFDAQRRLCEGQDTRNPIDWSEAALYVRRAGLMAKRCWE